MLVFKTADPETSRALLREVLDLGPGRRARRVCIDASNERYFATGLKQELAGRAICELIVAGEKISRGGEDLTYKTWLGSQLVHLMEDGLLALPEARYIKEDFRLVLRDRGGFDNQVDKQGRHGDTFDAVKLALHGLLARGASGSGAHAEAVPIGRTGGFFKPRRPWKNPYLKQVERGTAVNV